MSYFSPKFRIRSLLVLVALVALGLGLGLAWRRWATDRARTRYHAKCEEGAFWCAQICLDNVIEYEQRRRQAVARGDLNEARICIENSAPFAEEARQQLRLAEYHARIKRLYASRW